uniref:Beta-lactamase-related domain-containing protein n=1 Tax=Acrobeloides nanus TaxID=290746 RepID=A0A914C0E5_9BILA
MTPKSSKLHNINTFNSPELHRLEQPAALGITKARDLGKIFALMLQGELISHKLVEKFHEPQVNNIDYVVKAPIAKGYGFMYEPHPKKSGKWLFGHPGYGGSTIMMDPEEEIVIAYVSNGLKTGMGEVTRTYRLLRNAVFDSLTEIPPRIDTNGNVTVKNGHTPLLNPNIV